MTDIVLELYEIIKDRFERGGDDKSYTAYLFKSGLDKILKKIGEESAETIIAAKNDDDAALTEEICDLIYHVLVLMVERELPPERIRAELLERRQKTGNLKM